MKIKCDFCGNEFEETLQNCPSCGAVNNNINKTASSGPRTIEELKDWFYVTHGLTKEKTHIYIGEDCKEPACFGIYRDVNTNDIVVYKNKANGERAIRYQGVDEQYGVNELYQLIQRQALRNGVDLNGAKNPGQITSRNSALNSDRNTYSRNYSNNRRNNHYFAISWLILIIFIIVIYIYGSMNGWQNTSSRSSGSSGSSYSRDYDWSSSRDDDWGSSWDDDDDWDSGDWDSDWGANFEEFQYKRLC